MSETLTVVKAQGLCNRIKTYMSILSEHEQVKTQVFADSYIFPSIKYDENPTNEACRRNYGTSQGTWKCIPSAL